MRDYPNKAGYAGVALAAVLTGLGCEKNGTEPVPPSQLETVVHASVNVGTSKETVAPEDVFKKYWSSIRSRDMNSLKKICTTDWLRGMPQGKDFEELSTELQSQQEIIIELKRQAGAIVIIYDSTGKEPSKANKFIIKKVGTTYLVDSDG